MHTLPKKSGPGWTNILAEHLSPEHIEEAARKDRLAELVTEAFRKAIPLQPDRQEVCKSVVELIWCSFFLESAGGLSAKDRDTYETLIRFTMQLR